MQVLTANLYGFFGIAGTHDADEVGSFSAIDDPMKVGTA